MNWYKKAQYSPALLQNIEKKKQISIQKGFPIPIVEWVADISLRLGNPSYFEWLLRQGKNGSANVETREDDKKIFNALKTFETLKKSKKLQTDQADINKIRTTQDLLNLIGRFETGKAVDIQGIVSQLEGARILYTSGDVSVIEVNKYEAGQKLFSKGWCVQHDPNHFYESYGPPFIMLTVRNKPYALYHENSSQFKDEHDTSMSLKKMLPILDTMKYLIEKNIIEPSNDEDHSVIEKAIEEEQKINQLCEGKFDPFHKDLRNYLQGFRLERTNLIRAHNLSPDVIKIIEDAFIAEYPNLIESRPSLDQSVINDNAKKINDFYSNIPSYIDINKFPPTDQYKECIRQYLELWPLQIVNIHKVFKTKELIRAVEQRCAKYPYDAYSYAKDVLHGRFELGEQILAKDLDHQFAIAYAKDILHGRFELAEPLLAKDSKSIIRYSQEVLKGRFQLGERFLIEQGTCDEIFTYARDVVRGRFKEMEEKLVGYCGPNYSIRYSDEILKGRFELAEQFIAQSPQNAYFYAEKVFNRTGERIPLMEQAIATDSILSYYYAVTVLKGRFELGEPIISTNSDMLYFYNEFLTSGSIPILPTSYIWRNRRRALDATIQEQSNPETVACNKCNKNWYKKSWIKDETIENLKNYNFKIVDQVSTEGYDIVLTEGPQYFYPFDKNPSLFQIAIQKEDHDFSSREQQFEKTPLTKIPNVSNFTATLKSTLDKWLQKYKRLYFGSLNEPRNIKYDNILQWLGYSPKTIPAEFGFSAKYIE